MKILFTTIIIFTAASAIANVTTLSPVHRKMLLNESVFGLISATRELPHGIVELCARDAQMADPGRDWQETDVVTNVKLPTRRLIWAAKFGEYYLVHYESGGIAHSYHVLFAKNTGRKPRLIWHGVSNSMLKNFKSFIAALNEDKLDDSRNYSR